jgi:ATP-binding cassette subfamily B protein
MRTFEEVEKKSHNYFINHMSGDISGKISALQEKAVNLISIFIELMLPSLFSLYFAFNIFYIVKIEISTALFVWLILHMLTCASLGTKCSEYEEVHSSANNLLNGGIVDSISNHFSWRLFVNEKFEYENIMKYQQQEATTAKTSLLYIAKLHSVLSVLTVVFGIFGVNALGYYYWQCGEISVGDFVFVINATLGITMLSWAVGLQLPNIFKDMGTCRQAFSVISEEAGIEDISGAKDLEVSNGSIEFKNVSFGYGEELLFDNLSVKINPKEKIGLVGRSGNGKTTFCNLILRLYDLNAGDILIDDQIISEVTQKSLRKYISIVPQDPVLFHRSILENIAYGNINAFPEEIKAAAQKAQIVDFAKDLEGGYDFNVGECGNKLSRGQRQRIAIARAILKDAPILFLDEATSALDSISEKAIQENLDDVMRDKTVIAIAHRLSTLKRLDRIFVFDKGKIAEIGTHEELLKKEGIYTQLWSTQVDGFIN